MTKGKRAKLTDPSYVRFMRKLYCWKYKHSYSRVSTHIDPDGCVSMAYECWKCDHVKVVIEKTPHRKSR